MKTNNKKLEICFAIHVDYSLTDILSGTDYTYIYKNLFSRLYANPNVPITLALSGCFLDWAQKDNSHFFDVISEMIDRKQIEILGNAFYEPFMSAIPVADLTGQIEFMTDTLRKHFYKNKRPRGLYLPYFAWNPNSIHILNRFGFDYCLLDTRFFDKAGLESLSPVCMEDAGKTIFGIPATCEFENMDESPKAFYEVLGTYTNSDYQNTVVFFLSPETAVRLLDKESEDEKSWMDEFIDFVSAEDSLISLTNSSQILKPGKIYPKAFIDSNAVFANKPINSSVKQILVSKKSFYGMYAKMNYVHTLVNQIRGDKSRKNMARLELWHAEQGVLFNLDSRYEKYNSYLRKLCYRNLLLAEKQSRIPRGFVDSLSTHDLDLDGLKEFLSQKEKLNMYVHGLGGKIFELDVFSDYRNYADIDSEDTGLFIDHLITADELELIKQGDFSSAISNPVFSDNIYQDVKMNRLKFELAMKTEASFRSFNQSISLKKNYTFNSKGCSVQYIVKNESNFNLTAFFMVEIDIAIDLQTKNDLNISVFSDDVKTTASFDNNEFSSLSWMQFDVPDGKSSFTIESNEPANLIILPIYEKTADAKNPIVGIRNLFYWRVDLVSERESEKMLFFSVEPKKGGKQKK